MFFFYLGKFASEEGKHDKDIFSLLTWYGLFISLPSTSSIDVPFYLYLLLPCALF
jgi:hypothetical protein